MKKTTQNLILLLAATTLTNCSSRGFDSSSSSATGTNGAAAVTDPAAETPVDPRTNPISVNPISSIDLTGQTEESSALTTGFGKILTFDFDKTRGEFIVMVPMPSGIKFIPSGSFSKYPDITFTPLLDYLTGKMKFAVRIPVKYVIKGLSTQTPSALPNGDPLPTMPSGQGELPSLGLNFPSQNNMQISLYIGVNAIGLYVTLPINAALPFGFTLPVRNKDKTKTYGYLTYVAPKAAYPPGLFVSSLIPPSVAKVLEDYFKL